MIKKHHSPQTASSRPKTPYRASCTDLPRSRYNPAIPSYSPDAMTRTATISCDTRETRIRLSLDLDGTGNASLATGLGFFDHMLEQIARHGIIDLDINVNGDLHVDCHHTIEDTGIVLGQAVNQALGDKRGITRYGHAYVPLDEALTRVVIDFSGRPGLHYHATFTRDKIGDIDTEAFYEFFQGFANHAQATLHIDNLRGHNNHHIIETIYKAFGRALRMATSPDARAAGQIPSTKGSL